METRPTHLPLEKEWEKASPGFAHLERQAHRGSNSHDLERLL
jgi:hypothetical protein